MAHEAATAKDGEFVLISLVPDVCLTPGKSGYPVPYVITHAMDKSQQCSPNVFFRGKAAYLHNESFVDQVMGDEPGAGKGVLSQTHVEISHSIAHSASVFVNGRPIVRTGDAMWMNWTKPGSGGGEAAKAESEAQAKGKRWRCRQGQIAAAKDKLGQMPEGRERDKLAAATERFERNNKAVEHARLSKDVYDPSKGPPPGWKNISDDPEALARYGLKDTDLAKPGSDFRAAVYEPDPAVFGDDMKPSVVFKGTESAQDWKNNLAQGLNRESDYYRNAVEIGKTLDDRGANVDIVGHSLGGGLASAASRASGLPATTFNAAGLHPETVARYGGSPRVPVPENIQAFRVAGEVLSGVQEQGLAGTLLGAGVGALLGGPLGAAAGALAKMGLAAIMPDAVGTPHELPGHGVNPVDRHGMDQVIEGLEAQKGEDQESLAKATGKTCG